MVSTANVKGRPKLDLVQDHHDILSQVLADPIDGKPEKGLLNRAQARTVGMEVEQVKNLHALESNVVPHMGKHFGDLNPAQQFDRIKYLNHEQALPEVKAAMGKVLNQPYQVKAFKVNGIKGDFLQKADGSVLHYASKGSQPTAFLHGPDIANHLKPRVAPPVVKAAPAALVKAGQAGENKLKPLARARKAVFGNKAMKWAGKWIAIPAVILGGMYLVSQRGEKEYKASEHMNDPLPEQPVMQMGGMQQAPTLMGMEPVEGTMAQREMMRRGGQSMGGPINPEQTVAAAENMGAVPTR